MIIFWSIFQSVMGWLAKMAGLWSNPLVPVYVPHFSQDFCVKKVRYLLYYMCAGVFKIKIIMWNRDHRTCSYTHVHVCRLCFGWSILRYERQFCHRFLALHWQICFNDLFIDILFDTGETLDILVRLLLKYMANKFHVQYVFLFIVIV